MPEPLRIFIGYDERESLAYHVLAHSILRRASAPVSIVPLVRSHLAAFHRRPRGPLDSTDFSITRFLVPYLSGFAGVSVFMDCDMLALCDVYGLLADRTSPSFRAPAAVWVARHDYVPRTGTKFLGQAQTAYPRKNWSSLIVFENRLCRALTPEYVEAAPGLDLHRFAWLDDSAIGDIPLAWNWLVGEYAPNAEAKILHYTLGGPWFEETRDCDHADLWLAELAAMMGEGRDDVRR
jgi:hypothetical protein